MASDIELPTRIKRYFTNDGQGQIACARINAFSFRYRSVEFGGTGGTERRRGFPVRTPPFQFRRKASQTVISPGDDEISAGTPVPLISNFPVGGWFQKNTVCSIPPGEAGATRDSLRFEEAWSAGGCSCHTTR